MLKVAEAAAEQEQGIGMVVVKGPSVNREESADARTGCFTITSFKRAITGCQAGQVERVLKKLKVLI